MSRCSAGEYCEDPSCPTHGGSASPTYSYPSSSSSRRCSSGEYCEDPSCPTHAGKSGDCFAGHVNVLTPDGLRAISTFSVDDEVASWCTRSSLLRVRRVTKVLEHPPTRIWSVQTNQCSTPLFTTMNHRLLTLNGWKRVDKIRPDDLLSKVGRDGAMSFDSVVQVSKTPVFEKVYNLHTDGEHNFVAGGVVAHNFTFAPVARTFIHRAIVDRLRLTGLLSPALPELL